MSLIMEFSNNVLHGMKAREQKAQAIADGIISFIQWGIESHQANPMPKDDINSVDPFLKFETSSDPAGRDMHDSQSHDFWFYSSKKDADSTELGISTQSSGKVRLNFTGSNFGEDGETDEFNADAYSVEEAVAKIITLIQSHDVFDFGPLVTHTAQRLWTQALNNDPRTAPGNLLGPT